MPGHPIFVLYDPVAVSDIAAGLEQINAAEHPKGDIGPLRDYFEDYGPGDETLEDVCLGGLAWLKGYYRDAADAGFGIRVSD